MIKPTDPFATPYDLILHFFVLLDANLHAEFEDSSFKRARDMEKVPKFQK